MASSVHAGDEFPADVTIIGETRTADPAVPVRVQVETDHMRALRHVNRSHASFERNQIEHDHPVPAQPHSGTRYPDQIRIPFLHTRKPQGHVHELVGDRHTPVRDQSMLHVDLALTA